MMGNRLLVLVAMAMSFLVVTTGCSGSSTSSDRAAPDDESPASPSGDADRQDPDADEDDASEELDPVEPDEDSTEDEDGAEASTEDSTEDNGAAQTDPDQDDPTPATDPANGQDALDEDQDDEQDEQAAAPSDPELVAVGPEDSGEEVVAVQERLAELGFGPGPADGDYGRRTEIAVKTFQAVVGLPETGWVTNRTIDAMETYRYDGLSLVAGDEGPEVEELQARLTTGPFDPGQADGEYGQATVAAIWALEKLAGIPIDGDWGPADELAWERLMDGEIGQPQERHDQRWVEVDLSLQLMMVYEPGRSTPVLVSHVSSGSGVPWENEEHSGSSITPLGEFHINRRIAGWRESSLNIGRLYNPLYFNGGIAFHGATSVPLHPASHGCVRVPMHIAEYLPDELPNGTPVHVLA